MFHHVLSKYHYCLGKNECPLFNTIFLYLFMLFCINCDLKPLYLIYTNYKTVFDKLDACAPGLLSFLEQTLCKESNYRTVLATHITELNSTNDTVSNCTHMYYDTI